MKSPLLTFTSSAFADAPGDDSRTNPGVFGRTLATWLSRTLAQAGSPPAEVIAEDFGWCVPVASSPHRTYVACASAEQADDSWQVFVFAEGGAFSRIFGKDTRTIDVQRVFSRLQSALSDHPQVRGLRVGAT